MKAKETLTREYYKLRNPEKEGEYNEYYRSNNGTDQWNSMPKIKSMITRGQAGGYKGQYRTPFDGWEVVKVTEKVTLTRTVEMTIDDE